MTADKRTKRHGWAPGDYSGTCLACQGKFVGDKRAIQCADCAYTDWEPTHRHIKSGGLYQMRHPHAFIEATVTPAVIYEGQDGTLWVRPQEEFHDGRFVELGRERAS